VLKIQLNSYRTIFIVIGLIGVLVFASPTLALLINPPAGQEFSEIYILGPNHTFENIPFNITTGVPYSVYLGVGNNLGQSAYYTCLVKIGNRTASYPDTTLGKPSELPALYEYRFFVENGGSSQAPLTFQVNQLDFVNEATCRLSSISFNGIDVPCNETSKWDPSGQGFYFNLIFELWIFNSTLGTSLFNNRFVSIPLNMTQ
jgi:hypothetical protein